MSAKLTVGSLFSGIGGIDLGLERAGMETRWFSEIDNYASRVLAKHWPSVPNHGDITKIDFAAAEPVDVLCGGFPCQDISNAGKREGIDGERSGLWSEYARAIGELRPRYVFVENVAALLARGLGRVLGDLAALGYDAEWDSIPASAVGAPHQRDRLWLVAHARSERHQPIAGSGAGSDGSARPFRDRQSLCRSEDVADSQCGDGRTRGTRGPASHRQGAAQLPHRQVLAYASIFGRHDGRREQLAEGRRRARDAGIWSIEPAVGRVADGVPSRVDRLRGLGNAVVPQIPELIGAWIIEHARATGYLTEAA